MRKYLSSLTSTFYFIGVLLIVHLVWKLGFREENVDGRLVAFFMGADATSFFAPMVSALVSAVELVLKTFTSVSFVANGNSFYLYGHAQSIDIVWSCTGLKQMIFIFLLILCYPKHTKHKLWYIPACLLLVYLINVLRISIIIYLCDSDITRFEMLHEGSKYVFYGVMFLMWILWDWKIAPGGGFDFNFKWLKKGESDN